MTVFSDKWFKQTVKKKGMIKPFVSKQVRKGKISFSNFAAGAVFSMVVTLFSFSIFSACETTSIGASN